MVDKEFIHRSTKIHPTAVRFTSRIDQAAEDIWPNKPKAVGHCEFFSLGRPNMCTEYGEHLPSSSPIKVYGAEDVKAINNPKLPAECRKCSWGRYNPPHLQLDVLSEGVFIPVAGGRCWTCCKPHLPDFEVDIAQDVHTQFFRSVLDFRSNKKSWSQSQRWMWLEMWKVLMCVWLKGTPIFRCENTKESRFVWVQRGTRISCSRYQPLPSGNLT